MATFRVPIEAGHILQFARATQGPRPAPEAAQIAFADECVVAPPTFLIIADHFDPEFERRPRPGGGWVAPGATASDVPDSNEPSETVLPVEVCFEYRRNVLAGEVLVARRGRGRSWTKLGRRVGRLEFFETITEYFDDAGTLVATQTWLDSRNELGLATLMTRGLTATSDESREPGLVQSGAQRHTLVENLTRTQIMMFAFTSGDLYPAHHDLVYARQQGYADIFAQGMLVMAMTGSAITAAAADRVLVRFCGRPKAPVWPGDDLYATVVLGAARDEVGSTLVDVTATTTNQRDEIVYVATATLRDSPLDVS